MNEYGESVNGGKVTKREIEACRKRRLLAERRNGGREGKEAQEAQRRRKLMCSLGVHTSVVRSGAA